VGIGISNNPDKTDE
ncbi:TPA: hypothetical protein ACXPOI_004415, partial [Salmonella enterica]